jgi:cystathionine gamma-lyase
MPLPEFPHISTDAVHAGQAPEAVTGALVVPLSLATTYAQSSPGQHTGFEYSRSGNPTRNAYEACVAKLENGKHCMAFASGLAATTTITSLAKAGEHILSMSDVYGGTNRLFQKILAERNVEASFVDATNPELFAKAFRPNTKIVWIETPTNPTLRMVDIAKIVEITRKQNKDIVIVVDNTFMSSYFQRPLDFGADVVMHSVSKYMNGHSDVIGGIAVTNSDAIGDRLRFLQNAMGGVPAPFDCFMVLRGLKTLPLRMKQHAINAMAVARALEANPRVVEAIYPGLESHPQHDIAQRQCTGYSGMVSFRIVGGLAEATKFLESVKVFALAESLGAVESLAELPSIMTHASISAEERLLIGVTDSLVRLSVGVEDTQDLVNDVEQALRAAVSDERLAELTSSDAAAVSSPSETVTAAAGTSSSDANPRLGHNRKNESSISFGGNDNSERPSTRVHHPPGGKSNIFF